MPNPKKRHSRERKKIRRGAKHLTAPNVSICKTTGVPHLMHRAYEHEGNTYYRGKLIIEKNTEE